MKKTGKIRLKLAVVAAMAAITFAACDSTKFYDESLSLPKDEWPKDEAVTYSVDILDTTSDYRFFLNVRNSTSYKYNNIYFFLITEFPRGGMSRDTIECLLAAKDGEWLGKGSGRYRDNQILIRENIRFPQSGKYTFRLNQAMREDVLQGISEAGIRLEKQQL